jgi:hypothetical protein
MPKLSAILAIEKGRRTDHHTIITDLHKRTQAVALMTGHHKKYDPKKEDGETFPADRQTVQLRADDALTQVQATLMSLFDTVATKDWSNCEAKADIVLDGKVFLPKVPVTFLLFLEKELHDLKTFVEKMVELDPSERWTLDAGSGLFQSEPVQTQKTKKEQRPIVLYHATEHHPAQTQLITEDVVIGTWTTTKFSGALPRSTKLEILGRISKLEEAVKFAREQANSIQAVETNPGSQILGFIFKGQRP